MHYDLPMKSLLALLLILVNGLPGKSQQAEVKVVIDTYSNTPSLSSPVPLGATVILVCRIGGMMPDTNICYEWSCPNNVCNRGNGRYPNRRSVDNTLVVNIISESDAGSYSCTVKNGGSGSVLGVATFELQISGGTVVHSNSNLLPGRGVIRHHSEYAPVNAKRLKIHCSSHGPALWANIHNVANVQITNHTRSTSTLDIDPVLLFAGGQFDCYVDLEFSTNVYLFGNRSASLEQPVLSTVRFLNGKIVLSWPEVAGAGRYILSYRRKDAPVTVPPIFNNRYPAPFLDGNIDDADLVAGATYEIGLWAVRVDSDVTFISEPVVGEIDIPESVPSEARELQILSVINGSTSGVLLNWLPSVNPNGRITYFVQYSTDKGFSDGSITEVNTGTDTTYYSLTGLQQGLRYYFRVRVSNSAGSAQSNIVSHQLEIPIVPSATSSLSTTPSWISRTSNNLRTSTIAPSSCSAPAIPNTTTQTDSLEVNTGLISGVVVSCIVVVMAAITITVSLVVVFTCKKRRNRDSERKGSSEDTIYEDKIYSIPSHVNVEVDDGSVPMTTNPCYERIESTSDHRRALYANL